MREIELTSVMRVRAIRGGLGARTVDVSKNATPEDRGTAAERRATSGFERRECADASVVLGEFFCKIASLWRFPDLM